MKIDLELEIKNGRVVLENKTYEELNKDEKELMDLMLKNEKSKSINL